MKIGTRKMTKLGKTGTILLALVALAAGISHIRRWAYENLPAAAPGECVGVMLAGQPHKLIVLANDPRNKVSLVGDDMGGLSMARYSDLKDLGAQKVPCGQ